VGELFGKEGGEGGAIIIFMEEPKREGVAWPWDESQLTKEGNAKGLFSGKGFDPGGRGNSEIRQKGGKKAAV